MTFAPSPNFDPCDGADPRVELSADNPCRCFEPRGTDSAAGLSRRGPDPSPDASPALSHAHSHEADNG
jgi:hypothetical protein